MFKYIVILIALCSGVGTIPCVIYLIIANHEETQVANEALVAEMRKNGTLNEYL